MRKKVGLNSAKGAGRTKTAMLRGTGPVAGIERKVKQQGKGHKG